MKKWMVRIGALAMAFAGSVFAQDKSFHTVHYVTVDRNVKRVWPPDRYVGGLRRYGSRI